MALNKLRASKIRLQSMRNSLGGQSQSKKNDHVSFAIADRFNDTIKTIQEEHPEVAFRR